MLFMRVSMDRIWALFYMLQLLANLKNVKNQLTPANAQVLITMMDNVVCFKVFQNEFVQSFLIEKVLSKKTMWIKKIMLDQGIDFTNQIIFVGGLTVILIGSKIKICREYFEEQKKAWMWGGILRSKLSCYLPNCILVFNQLLTIYQEIISNKKIEDEMWKARILQEAGQQEDETDESPSHWDEFK